MTPRKNIPFEAGMEEQERNLESEVKSRDQELISKWLYVAIGVVIVIAVVAIGSYLDEFGQVRSAKQEVWGQFGDFIGGVFNPLLSFLALLAVLASLKSQSLELRAAREEASTAMSIQAEQTKIFKDQSDLIERQRFESSFYGLLDLKSKVLDELLAPAVLITSPPPVGRALIRRLMKDSNVDKVDFTQSLDKYAAYSKFKEHCQNFVEKNKGTLERYVNVLELLVEYVDSYKSSVNAVASTEFPTLERSRGQIKLAESKQFYADIIVATLSSEEVECLYLYMTGSDKLHLKILANKYELFRNLPSRHNAEKFSLIEQGDFFSRR